MLLIFFAILGLAMLYAGGHFLINGTMGISKNLKISEILVSSVIVGFGTSIPEFVLSVEAFFLGSPEIAVGNVVGSNIVNILFIIGLSAFISPFFLSKKEDSSDFIFLFVTTLIFIVIVKISSSIFWYHGLLFVMILGFYLKFSYNKSKESEEKSKRYLKKSKVKSIEAGHKSTWFLLLLSVIGMLLIVFGAAFFLDSVISIAKKLNINEELIGLGVVAFGSSIPELTASIIAACKKNSAIAVGNILGSNIFNILFSLGTLSLIADIPISANMSSHIWVMLAVTILFCAIGLFYKKFSRIIGCLFLVLYSSYFYSLIAF